MLRAIPLKTIKKYKFALTRNLSFYDYLQFMCFEVQEVIKITDFKFKKKHIARQYKIMIITSDINKQ